MTRKTDNSTTADSSLDDLKALIHEAEHALKTPHAEGADDHLEDIRSRLKSALDEGKSMFLRVRESATQQARRADEVVRAHPYHAIGIAAGLGAILGYLLSSRRNGN